MYRKLFLICLFMWTFCSVADATLFVRGVDSLGNQLIYDDDYDITFYDYTYKGDQEIGVTWHDAVDWAINLFVQFDGNFYDDWRLTKYSDGIWPFIPEQEVTKPEIGHLYYTELGNSGDGLNVWGPFQNMIDDKYWHTNRSNHQHNAYFFDTANGTYGTAFMSSSYQLFSGMAVRQGDVLTSAAVPEPGTFIMLGLGLLGFFIIRRER